MKVGANLVMEGANVIGNLLRYFIKNPNQKLTNRTNILKIAARSDRAYNTARI